MTPTAVTPAARTKRSAAQRPSGERGQRASSPHPSSPRPAHRTPSRRSASPSVPRRVSGPARSTAASAAPAARTAAPKVRTAVPKARTAAPKARTAAPVRETRRARPTAAPRRQAATRVARPVPDAPRRVRALGALRALPDHSLLDRMVRGRLWIPLLGILLTGIVAMQVEVLKLNASIGQSFVRTSALQSANQRLKDRVSQLSDGQRVQADAGHLGLAMPAAYTPQFLTEGGNDLARALRNIHRPDPAAFQAQTLAAAQRRAAEVQSTTGA